MDQIEDIYCNTSMSQDIVEENHPHDDEFKYSDLEIELEKKSSQLSERVESLKSIIKDMKEKLTEEKDMWKKEIENVAKMTESMESDCCCSLDVASSVTELSDSASVSDPSLNELSLLEFEKKFSVCEDVLKKSSIERRMTVRRHLAANAYKQRLNEIENMCNLELSKVKQNVQFLQPLQLIMKDWSFDLNEVDLLKKNEEMVGVDCENTETRSENSYMTMENIGQKIEDEINDLKSFAANACYSVFDNGNVQNLLTNKNSDVSLKSEEIEAL